MTTPDNPPSLDPVAAARWKRRPVLASPWLHEEVARRMQERLELIRLQPQVWADWEPLRGGVQAHQALQKRYPQAKVWQVFSNLQEALQMQDLTRSRWWEISHWRRPSIEQGVPPDAAVHMVWANMLLHHEPAAQSLLVRWHRALAVDGFLMFSCLGSDTLRELRALHAAQGWPAPAHEFTDMHDWGDMLVQAGFAEPVMDMERITLTYDRPERLLQELRELGRNLHHARFAALRGRAWQQRWLQAWSEHGVRERDGRFKLTFEVVYGHALKPAPRTRMAPQTTVDLHEMRQMLSGRA